jgi:steroid delta-isomerase-like uncharacterized protein
MADTAIFDVDGTLVDTNYQHALAWFRAFRRYGITLPMWRIHRGIGMGGDMFVPEVAGHDAVRALLQGMFTVFPDFHVEPGLLRHGDDHVLVEVTLTGTQAADWAGIPNTGRSFATRLAAVFDFEADQLVCERVYMDFGDIARQLTEP